MSGSDNPSSYTVAVFSDIHANRPYKVGGSRTKHNRLGNGNAHGLLNLPYAVDAVVSAGDFFDVAPRRTAETLTQTEKAGLDHRFHPEALIEQLLKANPSTQYHFAVGNHEGDNALNDTSPVIRYFNHLQAHYPNFGFADNVQMGNMLVMHGHSFIQNVRYGGRDGKGYDVGEVLTSPYTTVSVEDNAGLARAMCQTVPSIKSFIEEQTAQLPKDGKTDVYVFFAHTHRWFDETVTYPADPRVTVHVSNLGCLLPHSKANYKLVHFENNHVSKVETLDLHKIQR